MPQREVLEKDRRRSVQQRPTEPLATTHHVNETTLVQRLEHTAHRDSTNLLDLGAADRLTIRDTRQRLERGCREALRTRRELRTLDHLGVFGARENLPSPADLHELHAMAIDV